MSSGITHAVMTGPGVVSFMAEFLSHNYNEPFLCKLKTRGIILYCLNYFALNIGVT